ncbi:MAG TPA: hypothetical protein VFZ07_08895 [Dongiaceae bacterium]
MAQRPPLRIAKKNRIDQIVTPLRQARLDVAGGIASDGDGDVTQGMKSGGMADGSWAVRMGCFHARYLRNLAFWCRRLLALSKDASMTSVALIDINAIAAAARLWLSRIPRVMRQEA